MKAPEEKAFELAVRYLSYRSRSAKEIKGYLREKEFDEASIKKTVDKLQYYGYQNDETYTKEVIRQKGEAGGKGSKAIKNYLLEKGVEEGLIEQSLKEFYPHEKEFSTALRETFKFFRAKEQLPLNQIKEKLSRRLASRGFSFEIIKGCLDQLSKDQQVKEVMENQQDVHFEKALAEGMKAKEKSEKKYSNSYQVYGKVYQTLLRKGFDKQMIQQVMDRLKNGPSM